MKILYIACRYDPRDPDSGSSVDYELYHALQKQGVDLHLIGPFDIKDSIPFRFWTHFSKLLGKKPIKYSRRFLLESARQVDQAARKYSPDICISNFAAPLAFTKNEIPTIYMIDTTLMESQEGWPVFTDFAFRSMLAWEQQVIERVNGIICLSDTTRQKLITKYLVDPHKIMLTPMPASLPAELVPTKLNLSSRLESPLHLLTVGKDYFRKGVDRSIAIAEGLNGSGIPAELRIVGISGENSMFVKYMGLYKKSDPRQLQEYLENYKWADFLIHPARFEAAGIVPSEAAAFGVPTLTQSVGGLGTTVMDGISGVVLEKDSKPKEYIVQIRYFSTHRDEYFKLCQTTRLRYENELNWAIAGKRIHILAKQILLSPVEQANQFQNSTDE